MLPGAGGDWIADGDRLACLESSDAIGEESVGRSVAAPDHVAGAGGGDGEVGRLVREGADEAAAPAGDRQFGAGLAGTVGIVAAEPIGLAVAPGPLLIGIHLVGGDHHHGAGVGEGPERFQQVEGAEHVGAPGAYRIGVAAAHQGLGGEVKHDLRLHTEYTALHSLLITQFDQILREFQPQAGEEGLIRIRRQGQAVHLGTKLLEPEGQPGAFEAGMAS